MITIPKTMSAVLTKGHGGFEMLEFRNDINVPQPNSNQVLVKVLGAGVNNTDINTRTAWYSKSVTGQLIQKIFKVRILMEAGLECRLIFQLSRALIVMVK